MSSSIDNLLPRSDRIRPHIELRSFALSLPRVSCERPQSDLSTPLAAGVARFERKNILYIRTAIWRGSIWHYGLATDFARKSVSAPGRPSKAVLVCDKRRTPAAFEWKRQLATSRSTARTTAAGRPAGCQFIFYTSHGWLAQPAVCMVGSMRSRLGRIVHGKLPKIGDGKERPTSRC